MSLLSDDPYSILQTDLSTKIVPTDSSGVRALYWLGILFWGALLLAIDAMPKNFLEYLIVIGTVGVFLLGIMTAGKIDWYTESFIFKNNFYQGILISFFPLLIYSLNRLHTNRKFLRMALTAMTLSLLTLIDFWCTPEYLWIVKVLRTILQTMAISLIMLSLVQLYHDLAIQEIDKEVPKEVPNKDQKMAALIAALTAAGIKD